MLTNVKIGLAVVIGANRLRAKSGSGDAISPPPFAVVSISILLGILVDLFWPVAEDIQIAGSIASIILPKVGAS